MSRYILDTDTISLFQDKHPQVCARIAATDPQDMAVSVISVEEQLSGWYTYLRRSKTASQQAYAYRSLAETVQFYSRFNILSFAESAIARYRSLSKLHLGVAGWDLRIAATALNEDATVVTRNLRDFQLVPGLRCEDWSA